MRIVVELLPPDILDDTCFPELAKAFMHSKLCESKILEKFQCSDDYTWSYIVDRSDSIAQGIGRCKYMLENTLFNLFHFTQLSALKSLYYN